MKPKWTKDEELLRELREKKEQGRLAANEPPPSIEAREEAFFQYFLKAAINNALERLSAADRELVGVSYQPDSDGARKTIAELARERGCKRSTLHRRLVRILLKLRAVLRENN